MIIAYRKLGTTNSATYRNLVNTVFYWLSMQVRNYYEWADFIEDIIAKQGK